MELIQLNSFHEIVKTGSFSGASRKVFLSQSAVSHQIKNLEKEFNVRLFERVSRRVKLTPQGEILFETVDKILTDLENLKNILTDMDLYSGSKLTIAANNSILTYILPDIIKKFIVQFPKINFKLIACLFVSELVSKVLDGVVDFGIGVQPYQELPPPGIFSNLEVI